MQKISIVITQYDERCFGKNPVVAKYSVMPKIMLPLNQPPGFINEVCGNSSLVNPTVDNDQVFGILLMNVLRCVGIHKELKNTLRCWRNSMTRCFSQPFARNIDFLTKPIWNKFWVWVNKLNKSRTNQIFDNKNCKKLMFVMRLGCSTYGLLSIVSVVIL